MNDRWLRATAAVFLPAAAVVVVVVERPSALLQPDIRLGANDVPQQLAEDAVRDRLRLRFSALPRGTAPDGCT